MAKRKSSPRSSPSAYLILGEDSYLRARFREEIINRHVPEEARAFGVSQFSLARTPLAEALRAATTPSLLAPTQVVILSDVESLAEADLDPLADYLNTAPDFTVLVFEEKKLDRRTRVARLLLERCQVQAAEPVDDPEAVSVVEQFARELQLKLGRERAEDLVFLLGTDQGQLRTELEKLRTYVGTKRDVTGDDLAALVSPARKFSVFDLVDLLAERRRADALARLRRLLQAGESPIGIVGLLAWMYRQLLVARMLPAGTPTWKAAPLLRAPRSRVDDLLRQARRFNPQVLREAFAALAEADDTLKSSPPHSEAVLEALVARLTKSEPAGTRS